jgi:hypothetical protein
MVIFGAFSGNSSIFNFQYSILPLSSVMILKIRQYLSENTWIRAAKVFTQSVDITPSGFDTQSGL